MRSVTVKLVGGPKDGRSVVVYHDINVIRIPITLTATVAIYERMDHRTFGYKRMEPMAKQIDMSPILDEPKVTINNPQERELVGGPFDGLIIRSDKPILYVKLSSGNGYACYVGTKFTGYKRKNQIKQPGDVLDGND